MMEKIKEIQDGKNDPYHGIKFAIKNTRGLRNFPKEMRLANKIIQRRK